MQKKIGPVSQQEQISVAPLTSVSIAPLTLMELCHFISAKDLSHRAQNTKTHSSEMVMYIIDDTVNVPMIRIVMREINGPSARLGSLGFNHLSDLCTVFFSLCFFET